VILICLGIYQEALCHHPSRNTNTLQTPVKGRSYKPSIIAAPLHITCSYTYNQYAESFLCPIKASLR
jgi:hypothetical protein